MKTTNIIEIRRSIKDYSFNEEIARYKALNTFINSDINILDLTNSDFSMLISDVDKLDVITESVCWKNSKEEITELLREANNISDYWFQKLNQYRGLKIELWKARINQIQHLDDIEADINKGIYKIFSLTDKSFYENVFEDDFDIELAIFFTSTASDLDGIVWNGRQKVAFVQNGISSYFEITKDKKKSREMPFQTWQQRFYILAEAYQNKLKLAA